MQDNRTVVGSIFDGFGFCCQGSSILAVEQLASHDLHTAVLGTVAAGDTAYTCSVTVYCSDGTCYVCAVTGIFCRCPADNARVLYEVITIAVALVAVAVFVFRRTDFFRFIGPHVGFQVGVAPHYAFIEHCYNDRRVALAGFPSFYAVHIGTGNGFGTAFFYEGVATFVLVVPLVFQTRVVECQSFISTCHVLQVVSRKIQRFLFRVVGALNGGVALNLGDFTQLSQLTGSFLQVGVFIKAYDVPQVHTGFTGASFCFRVYREHSFKVISTQNAENLVGRRNTRTGRYPASACQRLVQDITHFRDELDEQFAVCCSHRDFYFRNL